jgi:hypothetical protein
MTSLEQRKLVTNAPEVRWTEVSALPPASIRRPSSQRELVALSLLLRPGTEEYARR